MVWRAQLRAQGEGIARFDRVSQVVNNRLKGTEIDVTLPDGTRTILPSVEVSYGAEQTIKEAGEALKRNKENKVARGERPVGAITGLAAREQAGVGETATEGKQRGAGEVTDKGYRYGVAKTEKISPSQGRVVPTGVAVREGGAGGIFGVERRADIVHLRVVSEEVGEC